MSVSGHRREALSRVEEAKWFYEANDEENAQTLANQTVITRESFLPEAVPHSYIGKKRMHIPPEVTKNGP